MPKQIHQVLHSDHLEPSTLDDFIEWLQELRDEVSVENRSNIMISIENADWDDRDPWLEIYLNRMETPEEASQREAKEAQVKAETVKNEIARARAILAKYL